ncbi:MAG: ABC transporter ATP-binding protein [Thermoanaerobaculia bacterium]
METLLAFRDLRRRFGRLRVLAGVSGEVQGGASLLVTGRNGSGKSTLLRCLAGLLAVDGGAIGYREDGRDLDTPQRRRRVGYVAPDLSFYDELTAGENLAFHAALRRAPRQEVGPWLERVDLPAERAGGALSSGMRQRLRWAAALLHRPRLLLLDEPFQNLDAAGEAIARRLLLDHLAQGGLAVIASPTDLDLPHAPTRLELAG